MHKKNLQMYDMGQRRALVSVQACDTVRDFRCGMHCYVTHCFKVCGVTSTSYQDVKGIMCHFFAIYIFE